MTTEQNAALDGVIAAHDPTDKRPNVISTTEFVSRFTNQEYIKLMQDRAAELADGKIGHAKNWDVVIANDTANLSKTKCTNLKADLVAGDPDSGPRQRHIRHADAMTCCACIETRRVMVHVWRRLSQRTHGNRSTTPRRFGNPGMAARDANLDRDRRGAGGIGQSENHQHGHGDR